MKKRQARFEVCCAVLFVLFLCAAAACAAAEGEGSAGPQKAADSFSGILVRKVENHVTIDTGTCGVLKEVLGLDAGLPLTIVIADDIGPTKAHYHQDFTEIYFVLEGTLSLKLLDLETGNIREETISANELCAIGKGIHHVVTSASPKNKLCVIAVPGFTGEIISDRL